MTPSAVYTAIRNQCAETSTEFWGEAEIYTLMSIAEKQIAQRIGNIEISTSITSTTGTKTYSISSFVSGVITRLTYDSYRVQGISINEIDDVEGKAYGGVTLTGQPEYYYRYADVIGFSPTPDDAKEIKIFYRDTPAAVTTSSTAFSIPNEYTDYIQDYCLYRMFLKDSELRDESIIYKKQWDENIGIINNHYTNRKNKDRLIQVIVNDPMVED